MKARTRVGFWLLAVVILNACSALPTNTRTGKVHDIMITEDDVQPRDIEVVIGDEVRFRNEKRQRAFVYFFKDFTDELSCQRGFSLFWGTEEQAKIAAGESASLCFARSGTVGYSVQSEITDFGGIGGTPGEITVPPSKSGAIIVKEGKP
jgi:plastocyanin